MIALGTFATWIGVAAILGAVACYWSAMLRAVRNPACLDVPEAAPETGNAPRDNAGRIRVRRNGRNGRSARNGQRPKPGEAPADTALLWGRRLFYIAGACSLIAAVCLMTLIMGRHYEVFYIWSHSDNSLPPAYRLASFWGGQEGTFVLWAFYGSLLGALLLWKARADERWLMPFFCIAQAFVFVMLIVMAPFRLHPLDNRDLLMAMAGEGIPIPRGFFQTLGYYLGLLPHLEITNGKGLNDLLQNPWMVAHPPTLFLGYASMLVPACFALGALMKRDYDTWTVRAAPWLLFSWMVLGTGIFLGGYWAYETLGWGGYWAWDPVENSSLLPWLVGTALIHGLLAQRARRNLKHVNLLLGILAYAAVLYGSFLTRSGVLDGLSVHAFAAPGYEVFLALLIFQVIWLGIGLPIWLWRFKDIDAEPAYESAWERAFGFFLGLIVLCSVTAIVVLGVSWPMISALFGKRASMPQSFYDRAILPVALVMFLLMAITPYAPWRHVRRENGGLKPAAKAILALSALVLLAFFPAAYLAWQGGWKLNNGPVLAVFAAAAALCLVANAGMLFRGLRTGFWTIGPWICHIGYAVLLIGVIVSTFFGQDYAAEEGVILQNGQSHQAFGFEIISRGLERAQSPIERDRIRLEVKQGNRAYHLRAPYYYSTTMEQYIKWPAIVRQWWGDLQIVIGAHDSGVIEVGQLEQGQASEPQPVQYYLSDPRRLVSVRLERLEGPFRVEGVAALVFRAICTVTINGREHKNLSVATAVTDQMEFRPLPTPLPGFEGVKYYLQMTRFAPRAGQATFEMVPEKPKDIVALALMYRPGVNLVWLGCYLIIAGAFICYRRRAQLAARPLPAGRLRPPAEEGQA